MVEETQAIQEDCIDITERVLIIAHTVKVSGFAREIYGPIPCHVMPRVRILFAEFGEKHSHPDIWRYCC
jgi:hypothetical protein